MGFVGETLSAKERQKKDTRDGNYLCLPVPVPGGARRDAETDCNSNYAALYGPVMRWRHFPSVRFIGWLRYRNVSTGARRTPILSRASGKTPSALPA